MRRLELLACNRTGRAAERNENEVDENAVDGVKSKWRKMRLARGRQRARVGVRARGARSTYEHSILITIRRNRERSGQEIGRQQRIQICRDDHLRTSDSETSS